MSVRLPDIAHVIRSKNAGPGELTLDIIFKNADWFARVVKAGVINREVVVKAYRIAQAELVRVIPYPPASAIKITLPRRVISGDLGDTDIYGAQQHAPLLELVLEGLE
jgi:hypothetical protein